MPQQKESGTGGELEQAIAAAMDAREEATRLARELEQVRKLITERKRTEEALRESEGLLAAIFAQAEVGLSAIAPDGRFQMVNDRLCAMLGRSREELLTLGVQDVTHPDDMIRNLPMFVRTVETGETFTIDKRYLRPDGTFIWATSSVSRIMDESGRPRGILAVTVDLTERRMAEEALREAHNEALRARAEAERANEAKSRFLASVSHDLRQPVMSANLFLSLLRKRKLGPAERELVEPLADSLSGLTGMLNGLLEVARLDAGIVKAEPREFPLDELLRRLHGEFQGLTREARLRFHVPLAPWTVHSDPLLVEMILRNLISNAVKYTETGGVTIRARIEGGAVVVDVIDTGRGIAPEELDRIFEDYYQAGGTARDHSRGFGIGLATVQRVSSLLGTRINVRSTVGVGSTFSLTLPLARDQESAGDGTGDDSTSVLAGRSVLVVDDEPLVLKALEMMLRSWGMRVHAVRTLGQVEAVLAGMDRPPDLVVADYTLAHGERGTQAIAAALQHGGGAGVLITGDTSPERLAEAERSGCRLLHKPICSDALESLLKELCAG